jgi:hypothetical protein
MANFLLKSFSEEQISELVRFTSFNEMKSRNSNFTDTLVKVQLLKSEKAEFVRVGKSGEWQKSLSNEMSEKVDKYVAQNLESNLIL